MWGFEWAAGASSALGCLVIPEAPHDRPSDEGSQLVFIFCTGFVVFMHSHFPARDSVSNAAPVNYFPPLVKKKEKIYPPSPHNGNDRA